MRKGIYFALESLANVRKAMHSRSQWPDRTLGLSDTTTSLSTLDKDSTR